MGRPRRIFVDFDHTLFGGNSSELFFTQARPRWAIASFNFVIRKCMPWHWFCNKHPFRLRDYFFFRLLKRIFPASIRCWRNSAPDLFMQRRNTALDDALVNTPLDQIVIVTFGMESIVRAMLRGSRWETVALLATPDHASLSYFSRGKLKIARDAYVDDDLTKAMLITDSENDLDLLEAVGYPVLIEPFGMAKRPVF